MLVPDEEIAARALAFAGGWRLRLSAIANALAGIATWRSGTARNGSHFGRRRKVSNASSQRKAYHAITINRSPSSQSNIYRFIDISVSCRAKDHEFQPCCGGRPQHCPLQLLQKPRDDPSLDRAGVTADVALNRVVQPTAAAIELASAFRAAL